MATAPFAPHRRGSPSENGRDSQIEEKFAPHRRGSTHRLLSRAEPVLVCPAHSGGTPSRKTTFPAHHRPIEAKSQKATPETTGQKTSQQSNSEGTPDGAPSRTKPRESERQSGKPAEVRTEETTDAGAEGTTTPQRPDKAGRGQVPWALQGLSKPSNPTADQMRDLPRQAQQEQVKPKRQQDQGRNEKRQPAGNDAVLTDSEAIRKLTKSNTPRKLGPNHQSYKPIL